MYMDEIVQAQKRGEAKGIPSICSAHPSVLGEALKIAHSAGEPPLIEATCNQVNQFGGYTGMTPIKFVQYMKSLAEENLVPFENIILGGDHLGPNVWRNEPAELAMRKSMELVRDYVQAGFTKIHLDCSMRLADDPEGGMEVEVSARRAAQLAKIAEEYGSRPLRYVIGTEVPVPGGARGEEPGVHVTTVESARQTLQSTREAFRGQGLESAWERVIALVVQPGVEFGDEFVEIYRPEAAQELSSFIESEPMVYEAHSTDYQTLEALQKLVQDHFAILKVGPALTFAYREAIFALAKVEDECLPAEERSHLIEVLEGAMMKDPQHWQEYYRGTGYEKAFKRKFSLSDRIRYYWTDPPVQLALMKLFRNLEVKRVPVTLLTHYLPHLNLEQEIQEYAPAAVVSQSIQRVLRNYYLACSA